MSSEMALGSHSDQDPAVSGVMCRQSEEDVISEDMVWRGRGYGSVEEQVVEKDGRERGTLSKRSLASL
jgi:hypothetical protein